MVGLFVKLLSGLVTSWMWRHAPLWTWNRRSQQGTRWSRAVRRNFSSIPTVKYALVMLNISCNIQYYIILSATKYSFQGWPSWSCPRPQPNCWLRHSGPGEKARDPEVPQMLPFFSDNVLLLIYSFYMSFHFRIVATVLDFSQEERGKNFLSFSQSTLPFFRQDWSGG